MPNDSAPKPSAPAARDTVAARGYPAIALEKAVDFTKTIYAAERANWVPAEVAISHLKLSRTSSTSRLTIAALKKFGLLEAKDDQVRVSERGLDILRPNPDDPQRLRSALAAAALAPPLHRELWEKYGGELPTDESIGWYLERQRRFNPTTVKDCIRNFRMSLAYAKLDGPQADALARDDADPVNDGHDEPLHEEERPVRERGRSLPPPKGIVLSIPTVAGGAVDVVFPFKVTKEEYKRITQIIELSAPAFVEDTGAD